MKQNYHGFTLVELIVVMVLIALISVFAVPRFLDLSTQSRQTGTDSIAATLTTVSAQNYAKRTANSSQGVTVVNCTTIGPLLSGGLPAGYSITSLAISPGASVSCTLNGPGSTTATFTGNGIA